MKRVLQPDFGVSGNSSSRHERPGSGSRRPRRRHQDPGALGNSKANIFGTSEPLKQSHSSPVVSDAGSSGGTYYGTPEAPRDDVKEKEMKEKELRVSIVRDPCLY